MTIEQRTADGVTILDVRGRLVIEALQDEPLAEAVRVLLRQGRTRILLNLEGVPLVDTMGLSNIVEAHLAAQRQGAVLKLLHLTPSVRRILDLTRLSTVFEIYDSEADALASYTAGPRPLELGPAPATAVS